jgi:hypothetical protein
MDVFSGVLMISMNDRVCEGFAQCDLNVVLALSGTAALPDQSHELIHEGRNRSHFAWQSALQFDARAVLIMGYRHSQTFFEEPHSSETITFVRVVPTLLMTLYSVAVITLND